jgi:fatty-acyl-CoA synthase
MLGLMQNLPLTVDGILDHARDWHSDVDIVSRLPEGPIVRTTYAEAHDEARRLSAALAGMSIGLGDRVATLAWNSGRHLALWYGVMGIGAVCHTLNPRLFVDQLVYIVNHARDRMLFADPGFAGIVEALVARCPSLQRVVILGDTVDAAPAPRTGFAGTISSAELLASVPDGAGPAWGGFGEDTAAGLCYTSGTTGNPKGVLYSHRSNYLHTLLTIQPDMLNLSSHDVVMLIVPMFHANAWGLTFSCPAVGAKLVMPGSALDPQSLYELIEAEGVTFSAGVPTVLQAFVQYLEDSGKRTTTLRRVLVGGSACSEILVTRLAALGITAHQGWGMTENSPIGTVSSPTAAIAALSPAEQLRSVVKQGHPPLGVELKIVDDAGNRLEHDGVTVGRLAIRGNITAAAYYAGEGGNILDEEGYFDTGDVATIDAYGYMQITDRSKDVVKSGGEWISSIEIENIASAHGKAALACVIGVPHPKWGERPLLLVKLRAGEQATAQEFLDHLEGKIARWWMPDEVRIVDDIPLGATGKIDKKAVRQVLAGT